MIEEKIYALTPEESNDLAQIIYKTSFLNDNENHLRMRIYKSCDNQDKYTYDYHFYYKKWLFAIVEYCNKNYKTYITENSEKIAKILAGVTKDDLP